MLHLIGYKNWHHSILKVIIRIKSLNWNISVKIYVQCCFETLFFVSSMLSKYKLWTYLNIIQNPCIGYCSNHYSNKYCINVGKVPKLVFPYTRYLWNISLHLFHQHLCTYLIIIIDSCNGQDWSTDPMSLCVITYDFELNYFSLFCSIDVREKRTSHQSLNRIFNILLTCNTICLQ